MRRHRSLRHAQARFTATRDDAFTPTRASPKGRSMNVSTFNPRGVRGFMLGSVLAIAATATLSAWAYPHGGDHGARHGGHGPMAMMGGSPRHLEKMLDGVNASDAQRTQVRQIAAAAAADLKSQREAGKSLRQQQLQLFTQPTVDANAIEALRRQMLAQHDQTSQRMTQAMIEISRVLTPEQRVQIAETMKSRRDLMQRHHRERKSLDQPAG
jgi:protein CpxP